MKVLKTGHPTMSIFETNERVAASKARIGARFMSWMRRCSRWLKSHEVTKRAPRRRNFLVAMRTPRHYNHYVPRGKSPCQRAATIEGDDMDIEKLLQFAVEKGASDLHLQVGALPCCGSPARPATSNGRL